MGVVLLRPCGLALPTEYGKRWLEDRWTELENHRNTLLDVAKLGEMQTALWPAMQRILDEEGVPQNITSGVSQYGMAKLVDHINGKTTFTLPSTVALALATTAPTSTTTGATVVEATYTGYGRQTIAASGFNAATAATPSVATNNGAITFAACTGGTSTLLGFMLADSATTGAGNALWYGTLTSTVISTTQTPATVATTVMNLSMTGT